MNAKATSNRFAIATPLENVTATPTAPKSSTKATAAAMAAKATTAVTVITNKGIEADAAATALVVAGLQDWPQVARALGLDKVAVVDENGTVYLSSAMELRIDFAADIKRIMVRL